MHGFYTSAGRKIYCLISKLSASLMIEFFVIIWGTLESGFDCGLVGIRQREGLVTISSRNFQLDGGNFPQEFLEEFWGSIYGIAV